MFTEAFLFSFPSPKFPPVSIKITKTQQLTSERRIAFCRGHGIVKWVILSGKGVTMSTKEVDFNWCLMSPNTHQAPGF